MFTKEQLAKWRSMGFEFDDFYDQVAVEKKKSLSIKYTLGSNDWEEIKLQFTIKSAELKDKKAIVNLIDAGDSDSKTKTKFTSKEVILTQDTVIVEFAFDAKTSIFSKVNQNDLYLRAVASCDGISAQSTKFKFSKIYQRGIKPPKTSLCSKEQFTEDDYRYIVTQLRKRDDLRVTREFDDVRKSPLYLDQYGNVIESNDRGKAPFDGAKYYMVSKSMYDDHFEDKEIKDRLFYLKASDLNIKGTESNYTYFTKQMNWMFKKYEINTCLRKIHFLAQSYVETNRFRSTYEQNPVSGISGGDYYRGRGMKQITHDYNYLEYYDFKHKTGFFKSYKIYREKIITNPITKAWRYESVAEFNSRTENKYMTIEQVKIFNDFIKLISTELFFACDAAGWYWQKNNINRYADKDSIINVSAMVNNPSRINTSDPEDYINMYDERKTYYENLKEIFGYEKK